MGRQGSKPEPKPGADGSVDGAGDGDSGFGLDSGAGFAGAGRFAAGALATRFLAAAFFGAALRADRADLAVFLVLRFLADDLRVAVLERALFAALRREDFRLLAFLFLAAMMSLLMKVSVRDHITRRR